MSSTFYCHSCAIRLGFIVPIENATPDLTGSNYQFAKFLKHTMPINYQGMLSIFNEPNYAQYQEFTVNGSLSGCCEIDQLGRTNVIWYAGQHVGMTFNNGIYSCPNDAVKVVLHTDDAKIHAYPVNYELHFINRCLEWDSIIPS